MLYQSQIPIAFFTLMFVSQYLRNVRQGRRDGAVRSVDARDAIPKLRYMRKIEKEDARSGRVNSEGRELVKVYKMCTAEKFWNSTTQRRNRGMF